MKLKIGIVLTLVLAVAGGVLGVRAATGLPDDAAFAYADQVVTEAELADEVDALGALYGIEEPKEDKARDTFRRDVAKSVAVGMVLDTSARKRDIVISDKSARDTLAMMVEQQLGADPQESFTRILSKFGVSEDDVLEEVKRQQAVARLFQEVTGDAAATVTPDVARAHFEEEPERFATPERRQIRNIVVASRKDAETVLAEARRGVDFAALARRTSLDDATRDQSGDLGVVAAAELDPAFAKAAFAAGKGALFGPVQTQFGWNVGQVTRVVPATTPDFEEVSAQVTDTLRSERALAAWRKWLAGEIRAADVEYSERYLPADPDAPPATGASDAVVRP